MGDLKILAVSGNSIKVSGTPGTCTGAKVPEIRRHATGIMEFVGDLTSTQKLANNQYQLGFNPGTLPATARPKVGQIVYIYCSGAKSAAGSSSSTATNPLVGSGPFGLSNTSLLIIGGVAVLGVIALMFHD